MAGGRNPSGIPSSRIIRPVYGPREIDLDQRVGDRRGGFLRVRRTMLISSALVAALVVVVAIGGSTASASGMAWLMLAPLLFGLVGSHVAVLVTPPEPPHRRPGHSRKHG